jgi:secondary thiamine-phosphate synthase enzyme
MAKRLFRQSSGISLRGRRKAYEVVSKGALVRDAGAAGVSQHHPHVEAALKESGVQEGLGLVNAMHTTASVFINDDERGLHADYDAWLERLAPQEPVSRYHHNRTGEDNADAHMKRQIMGREVMVAITAGQLDFGPWEQIFYGEFDGRRRKRVLIKVIGE